MSIAMKKLALLGLTSLLLLAACGQTGPLYLPDDSEPTQSDTTENIIDHVSDAVNVIDHIIGAIPTIPIID